VNRALHSEWTKLRTTAGPAWLALTIVFITVAVSAVTSAAVASNAGPDQDPVRLGLTGVDLGQAAIACLAALMISGEYTTGMIRTTLTAIPHRLTVLAAKAILLTGTVAVAGGLAVLGSLLSARMLLPGNGFTPTHGYELVSLSDAATLRAAAGTVLYLALVALLSLGIAAAIRDATTAIGSTLGLLYGFPLLTALVSDPHWHRHLEQIGPMTAGLAIQATTNLPTLPISPWAGLGVLAAWAACALLSGALLLELRDA
jgi:ABC-2 type transport system permease protein